MQDGEVDRIDLRVDLRESCKWTKRSDADRELKPFGKHSECACDLGDWMRRWEMFAVRWEIVVMKNWRAEAKGNGSIDSG